MKGEPTSGASKGGGGTTDLAPLPSHHAPRAALERRQPAVVTAVTATEPDVVVGRAAVALAVPGALAADVGDAVALRRNRTVLGVGAYPGFTNCANNWGFWVLGSRTQYNFTPAMYVGFDVQYQKLLTASQGFALFTTTTAVAKPTAIYRIQDEDAWNIRVRFHRDILP